MDENEIEVYLLTWNSASTLERCLTELRRQLPNVSCIVLDKFSTDETVEIAKTFDCDVIQTNMNVGEARSFAIDHCTKPYIFFLDSDVYLTSNYVSDLFEFLKENKNCAVVQGIGISNDPLYRKYCENIDRSPKKKVTKPIRGFTGATLVVTQYAKGFKTNASCYEDWLLQRYVERKGFDWLQIPVFCIHDQQNIFNTVKWTGAGVRISRFKPLWKMILALIYMPLIKTKDIKLKLYSFKLQFLMLYGFLRWDKYEQKFPKQAPSI